MKDDEVFARINRPAPRGVANQIVRGTLGWRRARGVRADDFRTFVQRLRGEPAYEQLLLDLDELLAWEDDRLRETWKESIPHPELGLKKVFRDARRASEKFAHWLETGEYLDDESLAARRPTD